MIRMVGSAAAASERLYVMQQEALDYRNPSTRNEQRPVWPIVLASLGTCLFLLSMIWCGATWNVPGRFIFVPAGDAAMGFRSGSGWLSWIEYTDWDKREYSSWSLPWLAPLVLELLPVLLLLRRARKRAA
jgi:hypothetical protein